MNEALKALGMTEEKAISILERLIAEDEDIDFYSLDEKMSFEMAISALSVLERAKAEIEQLPIVILADSEHIDRERVLSIVSKYRFAIPEREKGEDITVLDTLNHRIEKVKI